MECMGRNGLWVTAALCGGVGFLLLASELLRMFSEVTSGMPPRIRFGVVPLISGPLILVAVGCALRAMYLSYVQQQKSERD